MNSAFDPLTLLLIAAVIFIIWRFRSVLGQRTGLEKPPIDFTKHLESKSKERASQKSTSDVADVQSNPVTDVPPVWEGHAEENSPLAKTLEAIALKSNGFTAPNFVKGASLAYETILESYARGDTQSLKPLLAPDVLESFSKSIAERTKLGHRENFQFVGMKTAKIKSATLQNNSAMITLAFTAQIIGSTLDQADNVVDGDMKLMRETSDVWTFERDVTSRDPNWKLVSTESDA